MGPELDDVALIPTFLIPNLKGASFRGMFTRHREIRQYAPSVYFRGCLLEPVLPEEAVRRFFARVLSIGQTGITYECLTTEYCEKLSVCSSTKVGCTLHDLFAVKAEA
jgi:hypothetical protein